MATTTKSTQTDTKTKTQRKSYFRKNLVHKYVLDDEESFIEHKPLDEGLFQSYQDLTSKIRLDRDGDSTEVDMALGKQRHFLLESLVTGWDLIDDDGDNIRFTQAKLFELPPDIIAGLVEDIYKKNPILSGSDEQTDAEGK